MFKQSQFISVEPLPSSLPSSSSSSVPASTPKEPKAMSIAKAKQEAPQMHLTHRFGHTESDFPEPSLIPTPSKPKKDVPQQVISFPSRKLAGEEFGIDETPAVKRRSRKKRHQTAKLRVPMASDHWSPRSSRASSPARSAVPAEKWHANLKSSRFMKETDTRYKLETSASERSAGKRQEKAEEKVYNSWGERALEEARDEEMRECYNCGKKGHWFMDCLLGCGKCNGDGHRTIDCEVVKARIGFRGSE